MPLRMYNLPKRKTCRKITTDNAPPHGHSSTSRLLSPARDAYGRWWQKAAGLQIRLDNKSRQKITNQLKL